MTDVIYYTDNSLPAPFAEFCQRKLLEAAGPERRIISVSHKPLALGLNICVGEIGRSHLSIYKQILIGAEAAKDECVALAEHDCLYTPEHFDWIPPDKDTFYYNTNHWLVGHRDGVYSHDEERKPLSQLICGRDILIEAAKEKIWMLEHGWEIRHGSKYCCEFGVVPIRNAMKKLVPRDQRRRHNYAADWDELDRSGMKFKDWKFGVFRTELPNLDIRHNGNFTGNRVARLKAHELPFWGKYKEIA